MGEEEGVGVYGKRWESWGMTYGAWYIHEAEMFPLHSRVKEGTQ